jgi:hypothetical protein
MTSTDFPKNFRAASWWKLPSYPWMATRMGGWLSFVFFVSDLLAMAM